MRSETGGLSLSGATDSPRSQFLRPGRRGSARALVDSPNLSSLTVLQLAGNPIRSEAQDRLRARFGDRVRFVRDASPLLNLQVTSSPSSTSDPSRDA